MPSELIEPLACEPTGVLTANVVNNAQGAQANQTTPETSVEYCEEKLIAAARRGCLAAFQQLVECHEIRVLRIAQRIAHSREDAEDIKQDAFMQAFKNLRRFRGDSRFSTWLGRITINEGLMKVRRRRAKEISLDDTIETRDGNILRELEDKRPNPEQRYSQEEWQGILGKLMAQLSPAYRIVVQLRDLDGFSTGETAGALDVSRAAVKSRLRRARLQMRKLLDEHFKQTTGQESSSGLSRLPATLLVTRPSRSQSSLRDR